MTTKIGQFLKHWPVSYSFAKRLYFTYTAWKEYFLGTEVIEKEWATKHLRGGDDWDESSRVDWVNSYWNSQDHPHRALLMEHISKFLPNSILEIGCNCGPNLRLLARKFPDAKIYGVDINPVAVLQGNEWLALREGISNVKLLEGKADELGQFQNKSFDVVFTDAVLIYIGPDKIKKVIEEAIRITHRALIFVEWHSESKEKDPHGLGVYHEGHWKRDYVALLKQFVPEDKIHVTKISEKVWPDKNWSDVGALIEVIVD